MDHTYIAKALADAFYLKMSQKTDNDFKKPTIHKAIDECMEQIGLDRGKINITKAKKPIIKMARIQEITDRITIYEDDMDIEINGRQIKRKKI